MRSTTLFISLLVIVFLPRLLLSQPSTLLSAEVFTSSAEVFTSSAEVFTSSAEAAYSQDAERFSLAASPLQLANADDSVKAAVPFDGYDPEVSHWQWDRALIVGGVLGGLVTGIHIYQRNAWWKDQRTSFHFQSDNEYALNVDKAGHFFGGAVGSFLGRKSLEWSGASQSTALWGGFAMGALFELYVEIEDGFGPNWGFSPGDAIGDVLGAAWPVAQHYVPGLDQVHPKFSYFPSQAFRDGHHNGNMIDDYDGQTTWMGVHVHGLLPQAWKPYWPEWLGIAIGVSVRNMPITVDGQYIEVGPRERNIIIALDYDMTKIIPGDHWLLVALKEGLNFIHFPSPAIRISPNFISYGLYF